MIELTQSPSVAKVREYLNTKGQATAQRRNVSTSSTCKSYLLCSDCSLPVFADLNDADTNINDFNSYIYRVGDTETVVATLTNEDTGFSAVIVDNTYGTFYPTDVLKDEVWGFILTWRQVAMTLGFGNYSFNVKIDNAQNRGDFEENYCFKLMPFSCKASDGTVRLTMFKDGYIENGFDYRGLLINWIDQIRLYGKLTLEEHITTVDNYVINPRRKQQIQTQIIDNFNLTLIGLRDNRARSIIKDDLFSNNIRIDDYNNNNVGDFVNLDVALLSIDSPIAAEINGTWIYQIKLEERDQSTVKRNF